MARLTIDDLIRQGKVGRQVFAPLYAALGNANGWATDGGVNEGGQAVATDTPNDAAYSQLQGYTFDWQDTGAGNTGTLTAYDPSGQQIGSFQQQDSSGWDSFKDYALMAAAAAGGLGAIGLGPLGGMLGGASGAGQVGSSVAGVGGEAAANLAAFGATLTPAEAAAGVAGLNLSGSAGLAGAAGAAGAAGVAGAAGAAGAGAGAGAGAAGAGAAQAGFWGTALKTAAPVLGSVVGGLIQANAAGKAADAQTTAARAGMEAIQKALAPYQQAGASAIGGQQDLLGLNGAQKQQAAIDAIQASPAFTSQQQLGENRILANASATGGLRGGNVQGALAQFSPALLSQLIDQQYTRLGGLTSVGANAAAGVGSSTATLQGQVGSAQAGQALANGNAWGGVLNTAMNAAGQYFGGQQAPAGIAPTLGTNTPFGQFQLGGGF